ncbi:MAG: 4-vinyl reductase [Dehalococcoidales bacterium]|nr:4-vinyl reductase [Dehalococcoidales bacterium]
MEKIIDQAWESLLASVLKKRSVIRPGIGDEIDLYVPQSRLLSLVEADPAVIRSLYSSSRESARRNAIKIVGKLGMPADYFWKFEYWPKARAYTTIEKIVNRVFTSIMRKSKEGELKIDAVEVDPLVVDISFAECVECAGLDDFGDEICFYHAGTLAGILSGLINRELDGYESECHASGSETCHFRIFDSKDAGMRVAFEEFVTPAALDPDMIARVRQSLNKEPVRTLGNMVDITYHQLTLANYLLANPEVLASQSQDIGVALGRHLAPVIFDFYHDDSLQSLENYYLQLGEFGVQIRKDNDTVELVISECAEIFGPARLLEMTAFLTGELSGLLSKIMDTEMIPVQSRFEAENLLLSFAPKG